MSLVFINSKGDKNFTPKKYKFRGKIVSHKAQYGPNIKEKFLLNIQSRFLGKPSDVTNFLKSENQLKDLKSLIYLGYETLI